MNTHLQSYVVQGTDEFPAHIVEINPTKKNPSGRPLLQIFDHWEAFEEFGLKYCERGQRMFPSALDGSYHATNIRPPSEVKEAFDKAQESVANLKLNQLPEFSPAPRPSVRKSVAGFAPCIPSYLAGRPDSMFARKVANTGRSVRIVYDMGLSASASGSFAAERGNVIYNIISTLKQQGIRVEFWIVEDTQSGSEQICCAVNLLQPHESIDMARIARATCGPSASRLFFNSQFKSGLIGFWFQGRPTYWNYLGFTKEQCILLDSMPSWSEAEAAAFLKKELTRLGVEFDS